MRGIGQLVRILPTTMYGNTISYPNDDEVELYWH